MNQLQLLEFSGKKVRMFQLSNEPWWVAKDVCEILGYKDSVNAVKQHCRGVVNHHTITDDLGRDQMARVISEPDLYRLIARSNLPEAVRFEKWIFEEVLPQIRKTGSYNSLPANQDDQILLLCSELTKKITEARQLKQVIAEQAPKVALAEQCLIASNIQSVTEVANVLKIGRNKLFSILRTEGYLKSNNLPYQVSIDRGFFEVKEHPIKMGDITTNYAQTYITAKGLDAIHKLIAAKNEATK